MNELRRPSHNWVRSAVLPLLVALVSIGCLSPTLSPEPTQTSGSSPSTQPTEPPLIGDPLPGSFHLTSDPPRAPYPVTIRIDHGGGPSRRNAQFEEGDEVVVDWSTLPLPEAKRIEVNGQDCEGTFGIHERLETDLLLILTDDGCQVEDLGSHPEGGSHWHPVESARP